VGVADVKNQIHIDGRLFQRTAGDADFRHVQQRRHNIQQIQVMRLIFEFTQILADIAGFAAFHHQRLLGKRLAQPAVHPGLVEKIVQFFAVVGQREQAPGVDVAFAGRQRFQIVAFRINAGIEGQTEAVGVAVIVRLAQLQHLYPRPVVWAAHEGSRRVKTEKRQRQPYVAQQTQRLFQRVTGFRIDRFRQHLHGARQGVFSAVFVVGQPQQRPVGALANKAIGEA